jgi:hypothetical protein
MHQLKVRTQLRLNQYARRAVLKAGLGVSAACLHMIEQMIATGVMRMETQSALDREDKLRLAEENLRSCVKEMVQQAQVSGTFPAADEEAFQAALKKLCPMWPYC